MCSFGKFLACLNIELAIVCRCHKVELLIFEIVLFDADVVRYLGTNYAIK